MVNLFERLDQGRPALIEPDPQPTPQATPPEVRRLLDWLQHWGRPTICLRDIYCFGPTTIRDRESALKSTEILTKRGWLLPLKTHRYDRKKWQITIGPE